MNVIFIFKNNVGNRHLKDAKTHMNHFREKTCLKNLILILLHLPKHGFINFFVF